MATSRFLSKGHKIFSYTILDKISSGGFGVVYLAKDEQENLFAIKEYMPAFVPHRDETLELKFKDAEQEKMFKDGLVSFFSEAEVVARINSSKIVSIIDIFKANNTAYFVMPFEQGSTLQFVLKKDRNYLTEQKIREIFIQVADGIETLHQNGLLHLDIKPGNILLRPDGEAIILDLGTTKTEEELSKLGLQPRTPGFAAPEQHNTRFGQISYRTDVYGIGATMFSCITGENPEVSTKRFGTPLYNLMYAGQINPELLEIVHRAMELLPPNRYKSAEEIKSSLTNLKTKKHSYITDVFKNTMSFHNFDKIKL